MIRLFSPHLADIRASGAEDWHTRLMKVHRPIIAVQEIL